MILFNNNNKNNWVIKNIMLGCNVPECIIPYNVKNYLLQIRGLTAQMCVTHLNKNNSWPLGYRCPYIFNIFIHVT